MNRHLAKALGGTLLGAMLLAAGCVPEAQYKEALAAARRANEQLTVCKNALRDMRTDNQKLLDDIKARDDIIAAKEGSLADLQAAHEKLNEDFKALHQKYQDEIARGDVPTPVGMAILPAALDKALHDFARANPELVEYYPKYGMVKLKSDLTFAPGSVEIKTATGDALRKLVAIMNTPAAARFNAYIAGHTDDMPIAKPATRKLHPSNWYLSVHRAVAVQTVMVAGGLDPKRVGVLGFSEYHPVAPNKPNKRGNELNRRVEIWIVPPDRFLTAASG